MVVAAIAAHDFPDEWPSLMGELLQPLEAAAAGAAAGAAPADDSVAGVLRCLELCVGELDEGQLLAALERLLPLLLALYGGAGQPPRVRARAVRVLHRLLAQLTALCDSRKTLAAVRRSCAGWVTALLASLASAAEPAAAASFAAVDCSLQVAELRLLRLLVHSMPKAVEAQAAALLPPLGRQLLVALRAHEREAGAAAADDDGDGDGGERACDSDGDMIGGEALASQLFDVFAALAASSKFFRTLGTALPELLHAALGFLQIPPATQREWEADAEAYLLDEDADTFAVSVRVAAQQLLDDLLEQYGRSVLRALCGAARRRLDEAASARAAGAAGWWRPREAALLALGLASEPLLAAAAAAASKTPAAAAAADAAAPPPAVDALVGASAQQVKRCVLTLAAEDFDASAPPLLRGRALCCAACYSAGTPAASLEPLLRGLLAALQPPSRCTSGCAPRAPSTASAAARRTRRSRRRRRRSRAPRRAAAIARGRRGRLALSAAGARRAAAHLAAGGRRVRGVAGAGAAPAVDVAVARAARRRRDG